jgi:hypothetical protein
MMMATTPTGIVMLMLAGWLGRLPRAVWRTSRQLSEGYLEGRMRKLTLLDDAVRGFGGAAASDGVGEADRRHRVIGLSHLGGERRRLFGAGEGPAEAAAEAKQESMGVERIQFVKKFVNEQWILSCKSLGRPLVSYL